MRRIAGNIAVFAVAMALSLVAGEAILRAVVTLPLPRVEPEVRYLPHPVRRFTLRPSQSAFSYGVPATIDDRGFRTNGASAHDASGGPVVLGLGDSFTFGMGVEDHQTWPAQLERRLREKAPGSLSVINAGTISYGVFQELDYLKSNGLQTRPSVVVHALYWNDFMNPEAPPPGAPSVVTDDGYFVWYQPPRPQSAVRGALSWLTSRSAVMFALRQASTQLRGGAGGETGYAQAFNAFVEGGLTVDQWNIIEAFYRDLRALAAEHDFSVVAVIMPVSDVVAQANAKAHPYAVEARRRLDALGIPYVDGFSLWTDAQLGGRHFLPQHSDAHLDADGYRLIVDALARKMLDDPQIAGRLRTRP